MAPVVNEFSLRDYLIVLRRRKWVVVFCAVLVAVTALVSSLLQTPKYQAHAQLQLTFGQSAVQNLINQQSAQQPNDPARVMASEIAVINGGEVGSCVRRRIGTSGSVSVVTVGVTYVVDIAATSTRPADAATVANAYAACYVSVSRDQNRAQYLPALLSLKRKVDTLQIQIDTLKGSLPEPTSASYQQFAEAIQPTVAALNAQLSQYQNRYDDFVSSADAVTGRGVVLGYAGVPRTAVSPRPAASTVVGLGAGLVLGLTAAFVLERLDDSVQTNQDLERISDGLPTLAIIPATTTPRTEPRYVAARDHATSPVAESYRSLRTSVRLLCLDQSLRVLQITSPGAGEGKSTTVANLGVALAQAGVRTTLVCSDFRRPQLHTFFGLSNDVGFSTALVGDVPLSEAVQSVPGLDNLYILASGQRPGNPSELLSGRRVVKIFEALRLASDVVLVDAPPVLPVTDASIIGRMVDGTIVVARAGTTGAKDLRRAIEILRQVKVPLVGTVLNGAGLAGTYGYGYGYDYAYGAGPDEADGDSGERSAPFSTVRNRFNGSPAAPTSRSSDPSSDPTYR